MSDQYVFELQFRNKETPTGCEYRENQFVIIDGSSMADFSKLKEDLSMCMAEPFGVQYIDDEDDVISIDTEEEFREFSKIAKRRSGRGMLMRLILNANVPLDHGNCSFPPFHSRAVSQHPSPAKSPIHLDSARQSRYRKLDEFKELIKAELKNEILSELKDERGTASQANAATTANDNSEAAASSIKESGGMEEEVAKEAEYEEDSDGNMILVYVPEKKKGKLLHYQKRLEKKEKLVEAKIDQRLEKLEMKRKKLMEKYNHHHKQLTRKPAIDTKIILPIIPSAIATKESSEITKRITATKVFTHVWTIVNDGTVPLNNVELRHTWSSTGLEPGELAVKVAHLLPGQETAVAVRFRAPKTYNTTFISYWHLYRLVESAWQAFGHYVSMIGTTKPPKPTPYDIPSKIESKKNLKQDQKAVSFIDTVDEVMALKEDQKEEKVLNEESLSNISLKKQMEQLQATLASSEIAAEMAREAARLLAMATASAEGNTASPSHAVPKPSEGDKLNGCGLEETAAAGMQQLNLVDSEAEMDANIETNEDSDRGFVIVTMSPTESNEEADKHDAKEDNKTDVPPTTSNIKEPQDLPQHDTLPYTRLEPNVNYPQLFPPPPPRVGNGPVYLPHSPMIPNNVFSPACQPVNYPVFNPPQNPSSHGIVFPPTLLSIGPAKLTPPVNYSQIPTYPPIPTFPPTVPIPLSNQPPFVSQPPQMASQAPPHYPFNPFSAPAMAHARTVANSEVQDGQTSAYNVGPHTTTEVNSTNRIATSTVPSTPTGMTLSQAESCAEMTQPQLQQQSATNNEERKNSEPIQILPQALVDGAINVAATAYSTAWNALNNLRPKEGEACEFDPVFENNMAMLVEMGFNNLERNARLLKRFNNDISQVIAVICSTGGGSHNLDID